jgi:hypothetical protein
LTPARTVKEKLAREVPEAFVAVIVKAVFANASVGDPLKIPVVILNVVPAGAAGDSA